MKSDEELHNLADYIEGFVKNSESSSNSLIYKNVDLSHAMQRQLFVRLSNNKSFMRLIKKDACKDVEVKKNKQKCLEHEFLNFIEGKVDYKNNHSLSRMENSIKHLINSLRIIFDDYISKVVFRSDTLKYDSSDVILFANIDAKHLRYSMPIARKIGKNKCVYLSLYNNFQQRKVCNAYNFKFTVTNRPLRLSGKHKFDKNHYLFSIFRSLALYVDAYLDILKKIKPRVIVFTEGSSALEDILSRTAMSLSIPTIRVQYGRSGVLYNGYREMVFSKMLMWGEGFISRLKKISSYPEYIVTGPHILDGAGKAAINVRRELGVETDNRIGVLIATQPICATISYEDYSKLVDVAEYFLKRSDKYVLFIRKHQVDKDKRLEKLRLEYPCDMFFTDTIKYDLLSVLKECKYTVGFYSTVLSESIALGVMPIIIPLENTNPIFPSPDQEGAALKYSKNLSIDKDFLLTQEVRIKMEKFKSKYFYKMDGQSLRRVCDEILNSNA